MSPYLQELQIFAGQEDNYESACEHLTKYLRIEVNSSQMARMSEYYGNQLGTEGQNTCLKVSKVEELLSSLKSTDNFYTMMDGSMIPTREGKESNDWKEVKLGRLFTASSLIELDKNHKHIRDSLYVGHLGSASDFFEQLEVATDSLDYLDHRLVFINDGARWIWNWVESNYPKSTTILDFYHGIENIAGFIGSVYKQKIQQSDYLEKFTDLLLNDEVEKVIKSIKEIKVKSKTLKQKKKRLLGYLDRNKDRMLYKTFKDRGLMIGSGPIESAHRNVLQKRVKQSGQRWSKKGAQNIINLRIANKNGQWNKVIELFNSNKKVA